MNCPLTLSADNFWQCPDCGWTYKWQSDKPPRRNCPKATDRPRPTRRDAVLARYDAAPNPLPISRAEVGRRLDVCEACEEYPVLKCIRAGSACKKPEHWQQRVLTLDCERWRR